MDKLSQQSIQNPSNDDTVIYARYSSEEQNPTSIDDQAARCREFAHRMHDRTPDQVVRDEGVSVKDQTAPHWNKLLDEVRSGKVKRVYVDEFSRVTRVLEHLLNIQRVFRYYEAELWSVLEGVDIAGEQADIHVIFSGYKNQAATRDARHRVKRSMDGNLRRGLSNGDITFGYTSVSLTDEEVQTLGLPPRSKDAAPYKKFVVNSKEADVVRKIHRWFSVEHKSINGIARELNRSGVPRGGKTRRKVWKPIHVRKILHSRRYLGYRWRNRTQFRRNPDTGRIEIKQQDPRNLIETHDPALAIIDQTTIDASKRRFAEIHKIHPSGKKGWQRRSGSARAYSPKHLFSGTLVCGECGEKLCQMSGHAGGYYGCPNAPLGSCNNKAKANRILTESILLEAIHNELDEHVVVDLVLQILELKLHEMGSSAPEELKTLRADLAKKETEIDNLVEAIALGSDSVTLVVAIRQREEEKDSLQRRLRDAESLAASPSPKPTREWVEQQLTDHFVELLSGEATRGACILRQITGPIEVVPVVKPWLRKPHLVARLQIDIAAACAAVGAANEGASNLPPFDGFGTTLEVPLRTMPFYERYGETVVHLHDHKGMTFRQIARELPDNINAATVKIAYNFGRHGTPDPGERGWQNHCRRLKARKAARAKMHEPWN